MSDSVQKFYLDDSFQEENNQTVSNDVLNIIDLFRLLSAEEKIKVKQLIREERVWN